MPGYDRFAGLVPPLVLNWLLAQLPVRAGRALDAGCGAGRHTQALAERLADVVGVDISGPLADIARRQRSGPDLPIFPGARFENLGYAHGLVWAKKNPAAIARGDEVRREP